MFFFVLSRFKCKLSVEVVLAPSAVPIKRARDEKISCLCITLRNRKGANTADNANKLKSMAYFTLYARSFYIPEES